MKIPKDQFACVIRQKMDLLGASLPSRVHVLLEELLEHELIGDPYVDIFEAMIRAFYLADRDSVAIISNLMVPLNREAVHKLDDLTLSMSASLICDYLKKQEVLLSLSNLKGSPEPTSGQV